MRSIDSGLVIDPPERQGVSHLQVIDSPIVLGAVAQDLQDPNDDVGH